MSRTSNRAPQHSTGWGFMRILHDRGGKYVNEPPAVWGTHRALSHADRMRRAAVTLISIAQTQALTKR